LSVILSRSRREPRHATPGENRGDLRRANI
jgi:hypothetical protein